MLSRLLLLESGQLRRAAPFFGLYICLFAALTLADGLSLTLFVTRVGADQLPKYFAMSAACVVLAMAWYLRRAERCSESSMFLGILTGPLVLFLAIWIGLQTQLLSAQQLGLLFVGREVASALVLLHFGAYLQDFFTRSELNRVMPVIYAGGRVGGIMGAAALEHASSWMDVAHLLLLLTAMLSLGLLGVVWIGRKVAPIEDPLPAAVEQTVASLEERATCCLSGFLKFVWKSPLLFWITASTVAYFGCRACLNFQYSQTFEAAWTDEAALAAFLGRYTQWALLASLVIQLVLINRSIHWLGLHGTQLVYAALVAGVAAAGWGGMTLSMALFARFVESELRFGLRNPVSQMIVNQFPKIVRTRTRAWSLGLVIPLSTLTFSAMLAGLLAVGFSHWIPAVALTAGLVYLVCCWCMVPHIEEPTSRLGHLCRRILHGGKGAQSCKPVTL